MKTTEPKNTTPTLQAKKERQPFFGKNEGGAFFSENGQSGDQSFFSNTTVQTKLTIGQPNDRYEQEADSTAEKVVNRINAPTAASPTTVQTKSLADNIQTKPAFESEEDPQPKLMPKLGGLAGAASRGAKKTSSSFHSRLKAKKGGGNPLPKHAKGAMESAFGADFNGVRVHQDGEANQMNKELGAKAFTHGSDIFFRQGQFNPDQKEGQNLLAHELTHTVQQGAVNKATPDRKTNEENRTDDSIKVKDKKATNTQQAKKQEETVSKDEKDQMLPSKASSVEKEKATQPKTVKNTPAEPAEADKIKDEKKEEKENQKEKGKATNGKSSKEIAEGDGTATQTSGKPAKVGKEADTQADGKQGEAAAGKADKGTEETAKIPEVQPDTSNSAALLNSVKGLPATSFVAGMQKVSQLSSEVQQGEKQQMAESLPKLDKPTGLPPKKKTKIPAADQKVGAVPDVDPKKKGKAKELETKHVEALGPVPNQKEVNIKEPKEDGGGSWWNRMFSVLKRGFSTIQTKDNTVNTAAGPRPKVDTSGEADPQQNEEAKTKSDTKLNDEKAQANQNTKEYRGENDIYPEVEPETLESSHKISQAEGHEPKAFDLKTMAPDVRQALDTNLQGKMDQEARPEIEKNEAEYAKYQENSAAERAATDQQINDETKRVRAQQEAEQSKSKAKVNQERAQWIQENEGIKKEYDNKSAEKRKEIDQKIETEVASAETKADTKMTEAEEKATAEKRKAEAEAERKKKEEENKPRSWWDRVKGAVASVFNAIRKVVNGIFNALRKLVKGIIEAVKKVVSAIIEVTRKAIVGMIKAFGAALKVFVSVALAAFPEARKRALAAIDKAVAVAVDVVNKLAAGLKKFVNKLLDALGAALDFILSAYQKVFNAIIDVVEFLVVGLMKIMEGIANLVSAGRDSPDHFWGQLSEELLGQDVTKPLPNERPLQPSPAQAAQSMVDSGEASPQEAQLLNKSAYSPDDVVVDPVQTDAQLDPELMTQLADMRDGEIEFGQQSDEEHSMDAVQQDLATPEEGTDASPPMQESEQAEAAVSETETSSASPGAATGQEMVGPFKSAGERAAHLIGKMKEGIKKWWSDNKVKIIAALVAGILGLVLANVLTGGAIMAALPLVMQILSAVMAADALINLGKYIGKYLGAAWPGRITEGAKNLARGFAIAGVELLFALLFGGKAVVKGVKAGVKAAAKGGVKGVVKAGTKAAKTGVKTMVKTNVRAAKDLAKVSKRGFQTALKNGKIAFKGVRKGFAKGARSLDDLGKRLAKKFRFKKFKIVVKNKRFKLLGLINPWVLMASGEIVKVEGKAGKGVGQSGKFTDEATGEIVEGLLIGGKREKSLFVKNIKDADGGKKVYSELTDLGSDAARKKRISGGSGFDYKEAVKKLGKQSADAIKGRGVLAKVLGKAPSELHQAHHLIPVGLISKSKLLRKAIEGGFEFNSKLNGRWVKQFSSKVDELADGLHASHDAYNDQVLKLLDNYVDDMIGKSVKNISEKQAKSVVEQLTKDLGEITDVNIGSNLPVKINDLKLI